MTDAVRTVLQVNTRDRQGGAEQVALNLHRAYRSRGLDAHLAVGDRRSREPGVLALSTGAGRLRLEHRVLAFARAADAMRGRETFRYPATYRLLGLAPRRPDVIHAHNLHGGYFDLRALPWLGDQVPLTLTLHDAWLLSGHCSHSFDCERWRTGCGECPDLAIYPALRRDGTAGNWRRKRDIYTASRIFVVTPCAWLMERVGASMLDRAIVDRRVIPNGVDLSVFRPGHRADARTALGIPDDRRVLLFVASGGRDNPFKDFATVRAAVERIGSVLTDRETLCIALGGTGPAERLSGAELRFVPYEDDAATVARYYQAADVYLHAARAETFPNSILEALACGTPVAATAVGGIPEQVRSLASGRAEPWAQHERDEATGILSPAGDAPALADAALRLLTDDDLRTQVGENAARDAARRFALQHQVDAYLEWYGTIMRQWKLERPAY